MSTPVQHPTSKTAYVVYGLLGIVWGSTYLLNKVASEWISPLDIVLVRVVTGFVPILIVALALRALAWWHLRHTHHFLVMSLLAATLYYYAFAAGAERLPSSVAGMLAGATPLFSFLGAALFLRDEPIKRRSLLGLLCGAAGVVAIARPWNSNLSSSDLAGIAYIIAGSVSVGLSFVYARRYLTPLGITPIALCTYQLGLASIMMLLLCDPRQTTAILANWQAATGLIIGVGLLGTGLAYSWYYYLLEKLGAMKASSVTYLPPVVAMIIGTVFAGEQLQQVEILAAGAILVGVFIMQSGKRPATATTSSSEAASQT